MKNKKANKIFKPEPDKSSRDNFQLKFNIVLCVVIFLLLNIGVIIYSKSNMWFWLSYSVIIFAVLYFLYALTSAIRFLSHIKRTTYTFEETLRRQMTSFICDAVLGRISKKDLERLRYAADNESNIPEFDDFSLMSRDWFFWRDGFRFQDEIKCKNCGSPRKDHTKNGDCP